MAYISSKHSKRNIMGPLNGENTAEEINSYVFNTAFPASLFSITKF